MRYSQIFSTSTGYWFAMQFAESKDELLWVIRYQQTSNGDFLVSPSLVQAFLNERTSRGMLPHARFVVLMEQSPDGPFPGFVWNNEAAGFKGIEVSLEEILTYPRKYGILVHVWPDAEPRPIAEPG